MDRYQTAVRDFMKSAGQTCPDKFLLSNLLFVDYTLRENLILEEAYEYLAASKKLRELLNDDEVLNVEESLEVFADVVDSIVDILYVVYGTANAFGIDLDMFFNEVHEANMSKVSSGTVNFDAAGKVTKPDGWSPPDIVSLLKLIVNCERSC